VNGAVVLVSLRRGKWSGRIVSECVRIWNEAIVAELDVGILAFPWTN
jgi:hypothetical protein